MSNPNENKQENNAPQGKKKGWFSRRYRSEDESRAAKKTHFDAQCAGVKPRRYTKRTPLGQLRELNRRLGKGVGAAKERARLQAQIAAEKAAKTAAQ